VQIGLYETRRQNVMPMHERAEVVCAEVQENAETTLNSGLNARRETKSRVIELELGREAILPIPNKIF